MSADGAFGAPEHGGRVVGEGVNGTFANVGEQFFHDLLATFACMVDV